MKKNNSLDGHTRKRIYLFRHGEVNYMPEGKVVKDPNEVDLTDKGLMPVSYTHLTLPTRS